MKKFTLFLSAMLFSVMSFAGLGEGYTKVTDITTLAAGDKVVLYCDGAELGVTGYNGNKDATAAATGWVEYVVETATGGVLLKDGEQYISLTAKNTFKYAATGSVCKVTTAGVLYCTLSGTDYLLYQNNGDGGPFYRMYTDKTGSSYESSYKPFYVYKVGEGSGNNPGGETPETVTVSDLDYAMAFYEEEDGFAYWEIQLFNTDATGEYIEFPMAAVAVQAKSKTALNGIYDLLLALYGTGEDAEGYLEGVYMSEDAAGTLTIKNIDNEGTYSFVGSFVGEDGKTYKINTESFMMWVEDGVTGGAIELDEDGGNTPVTPPAGGIVTFDADEDKGNATETQAEYQVAKQGVTMVVSSGRLGTFNSETHYRIYKNQTLTLTSTVGNIIKVEFTCTANDDAQYGPGCFTVADGSYSYSGAVGTWTGSANEVVFTASLNQVRASQIVVTLATETTGVENVTTVEIPVKVMQNGQLMIISGENVYNILGAQVK
jgi:hypothetical protein